MPVGRARVYEDYELLVNAFPDKAREEVDHSKAWTPADFYDSVHVPSKNLDTPKIYDNVLESDLYPFQKRAVSWMLAREGVRYEFKGLSKLSGYQQRGASFHQAIKDIDGRSCYIDYLQGIVSRIKPSYGADTLSGGLLAEEMGLGKTVELMALLSLHPRPSDHVGDKVHDEVSEATVTRSKATLIITPPSILHQWQNELSKHAPALKVHVYQSIPSNTKKSSKEAQVINDLATKYDVVLATYNTLGREVHFAEDPPDRDMRHKRKYERKRSPLVQIQWWRVCLDEAQMVESGVTAAARVACRLPRVNSWAVTGTPLRKDVQDLRGLLIFLRFRPLSESAKLWAHLIRNHRHLFRELWASIALRHTKAHIREELRLPSQKRVVLTVPFSAIEHQNYATLFDEMCEEVGLNKDGSPRSDGWDPNEHVEPMRMWLARLRQTCLHPQVGGRNRRALGKGAGPLRTVAEVLQVMIDQNETALRIEERAVLFAQVQQAHILGNNNEDIHRSEKALEIYKRAMNTAAQLVQEARDRLVKARAAAIAEGESTVEMEVEDEESDSEVNPELGRLSNALRTTLQLQHVCTFFAATACYQIKDNEALTQPNFDEFKELEEQETYLYESAKALRREILGQSSRKAEVLMKKIHDKKARNELTQMPTIHDLELSGIESRRIIEKSDELFDVIRAQGEIISEWRGKMADYLLKPLVDEETEGVEITGEEYETSTKQQDELYVYFDAIKAMQADMNTFITGEGAPLIDHEVKESTKLAKKYLDPEVLEEFKVAVHAPELYLKLMQIRDNFRQRKEQVGSVRGLMQEARAVEGSLQYGNRAEVERALMQRQLQALNKILKTYTTALTALEKEIDLFRSAQNQRLEFYRQLQELSDAVAPYKEEPDEHLDELAYDAATDKEQQLSTKLAQLKTKNRFLLHLKEEESDNKEGRICVICQTTFENGVLTVCGHQYCKECIQHWWRQHHTCPVCKRRLVAADFHNITYKPQELKAQEENHSGTSSPGGSQTSQAQDSLGVQSSIYSDVDTKLMDEIKAVDLPASYGTKIDTLGRHLHWIREHDPGAKSIVFSQYREFLDVLGTALQDFKIGYVRLGRNGAVEKFRHDPSVDCLLLDAKTDSSGLTLVNATHVFICEPLIQTAVELQAIARVHRIGQTRPTTVWMYLVNDTVEESVYEISVARRLAHVQSRQAQDRKGKSRSTTPAPGLLQEVAIDAANSEELQSAPLHKLLTGGKGGGEMVGREDLWQCLFGKAQKAQPSIELQTEVGRHLRAEAAEARREGAQAVAGAEG
ncbi:SNF2 family DNA-dependent ATPase domain-containing protein [Teratosphaeria nubilosa]|uniref:SNF2 family DNA-dependent ATPase domain-containing protein n=1 Tax=Teratosphaeria nubilosa TaxID=161662 RepID=A0A6G1L8X7_9PEZI|nr:SNF2 family DNA-dependent ATPase domain-containing protein [Teratosphaeria nubilosa]